MASRNANRVAAARSKPRKRPIEMVAPERETPGTSAAAWARPISSASRRPIFLIARSLRPYRSAMPSTTPSTTRVLPMIHRLRKSCSMTSLSAMPSTTIGSEPMMMYQPIRASTWPRHSGWNSERSQVEAMRQMSWRK